MYLILAPVLHEGHGFWSDTVVHLLMDHGFLVLALVLVAGAVGGSAARVWARRRARTSDGGDPPPDP